jgi:hypothetical protein
MLGSHHLSSPKGHYFVLVATDYFTKWIEAVTLKNMTHNEVIEFVTKHIIHRFSIPHTLTRIEVHLLYQTRNEILLNYIRSNCLIHSYYAEANGQAKSSNNTLVKPIKNKLRTILGDGKKFCLKLHGLIVYLDMMLLKLLFLRLYMDKKLCYLFEVSLEAYRLVNEMIHLLLCIMT